MPTSSDRIAAEMIAGARAASFTPLHIQSDSAIWSALKGAFRALDKADLGDLPGHAAGLWSRRNLEAIIDDIQLR